MNKRIDEIQRRLVEIDSQVNDLICPSCAFQPHAEEINKLANERIALNEELKKLVIPNVGHKSGSPDKE